MLGNYFKKAAVLNAQGNSSMKYKIKNLTLDLDDGSEISFGEWVMQDSFHMKFYYQDFFKVYCIAAYRIGEELIRYKNCRSNRNKVGKVSKADIQKIAELKMPDLNAANLESAMSMIEGTAKSMGLVVED